MEPQFKPQTNQFWSNNSLVLKLFIISIIALILLIPKTYVSDLIEERQSRQEGAVEEIQEKWSREQVFNGPILSLPYFETKEENVKGEVKLQKIYKRLFVLPEQLDIHGVIQSESLHRGIFDVAVYSNDLKFTAKFSKVNFAKLAILPDQILWEDASIYIGISDLRGLKNNPNLFFNGVEVSAEPNTDSNFHQNGLSFHPQIESGNTQIEISGNFQVKGSNNFSVTPLGKKTTLSLSGDWTNPSFQGEFLPETREVTNEGFESYWSILHYNRPFGQEFINTLPNFHESAFGLSLKLAVDQYQQSMRTSKYAGVIIILSFLSLFLMETFSEIRIHPLQYILIGFALVLYYTLLIAFSEQLGYTISYLIASLATVSLLALYSKSLFTKLKSTLVFSGILSAFYIFIFVIIKEQDYALLTGSIGLFMALSITMFITRKIDWYQK